MDIHKTRWVGSLGEFDDSTVLFSSVETRNEAGYRRFA